MTAGSAARAQPTLAMVVLAPQPVLGPILSQPVQRGQVAAAMLADSVGVVVAHSMGAKAQLIRLNGLVLAARRPKGQASDPILDWPTVLQQPQVVDVRFAGERFRLYTSPCCHTAAGLHDRQFVTAALVRQTEVVASSLRVSHSILGLLIALVILAGLSWPFLKLLLVGPLQRIQVSDVVGLGICTPLAIALFALFCLDLYAYGRFRATLDEQLEDVALRLSGNISNELKSIKGQLSTYARTTPSFRRDSARVATLRALAVESPGVYPFFESWALIDSNGRQSHKRSTALTPQPTGNVRDRRYFRDAVANLSLSLEGLAEKPDSLVEGSDAGGGVTGADSLLSKPDSLLDRADRTRRDSLRTEASIRDQYTIESIVSYTTAKRQAIVAMKTGQSSHPVASIAPDLISVFGAILPPSFSFAVIDERGAVQFHSDPTRNLSEDFFAETDMNRPLRAAVYARVEEMLSVRYSGVDHRIFVKPLDGLPWSLVVMRDRTTARIVNLEIVGTSAIMTTLYILLLVLGSALVLWIRSDHSLPWLWPDAKRRGAYAIVAAIHVLLLAMFASFAWMLEGDGLLVATLLIPFLSLVLTARVVGASPDRTWLSRVRDFGTARPYQAVYQVAGLLVVWTVAVAPAIGFFAVSHRWHTEAFVKFGQYGFAEALVARERRIDSTYSAGTYSAERATALSARRDCIEDLGDDPLCGLDLHYRKYFDTEIRSDTTEAPWRPDPSEQHLRRFLEPYVAEQSVRTRALLRNAAADGRWRSTAIGNELWFEYHSPVDPPMRLMRSTLPTLQPRTTLAAFSGLAFLFFSGLVTWGAIGFVARRLFIIDLPDRLGASADPRKHPGENLIACVDPTRPPGTPLAALYAEGAEDIDLDGHAADPRRGWFGTERFAPGRRLRVTSLRQTRPDPKVDQTKVAILADLVIDRLCTVVWVTTRPEVERLLIDDTDLPASQQSRRALLREAFIFADVVDRTAPVLAVGRTGKSALESETSGDPILQQLVGDDPASESAEQVYDDLAARARTYYESIWRSCTLHERILLLHIAEDHYANVKDRQIVRRLLGRGLIYRAPRLTLMNESFRRFVVERDREVEREAAAIRTLSPWDAVRWPLLFGSSVLLVFIFATQQEVFEAANGFVVALAGALPALSRAVGWFFERRGPAAPAA